MKYHQLLILFLGLTCFFVEAASLKCKKSEWYCDDGTCIDATKKCNGAVDCPDSSDESFTLCRHNFCSRGFRCVYGGCVDKHAACNGVQDCADNSDELLRRCKTIRTPAELAHELLQDPNVTDILRKERYEKFKRDVNSCKNGEVIGFHKKCDGKVDCQDLSDETLETCASDIHTCQRLSGLKFRCRYGGCVDSALVCNGVNDCADGSDELEGVCAENVGEWYCEDGTRIDSSQTCDGLLDCPDGSDETFLLCWNNKRTNCSDGFRCVYGGCVASNATCNGIKDCADNSDELLLKCRGETTTAECLLQLVQDHDTAHFDARYDQCERRDSTCDDGQHLAGYRQRKCDGWVDCQDGSDEVLETCATDINDCTSRGRFRCQNGGCIHPTFVCDGEKHCADGSDEFHKLCSENKRSCVLPDFPKNGNYTIPEIPNSYPGQIMDEAMLIFTCHSGYKLIGQHSYAYCKQGHWLDTLPKCVSQCRLDKQDTLIFWCLPRGPLVSLEVEQECGDLVPEGATVRPECREPIYDYTKGVLPYMHCVDGSWDIQIPSCSPECGILTSEGEPLVINGTSAKRGELPWHAGIYRKTKPYEQICGGSLISKTVIISAAHCFWLENKLQSARNYAAALGKLYRPWNDPNENGLQRFNIREIKVPPRFHGIQTNFQDDIALVILNKAAEFVSYVRPVCLDFDYKFEKTQLVEGNKGKVAGWGLTALVNGKPSPVLKVTELPYINISRCFDETDFSFHGYITSDKICAGIQNGSQLCKGDSGGGLVFPAQESTEQRYFLRGLVSTMPRDYSNEFSCSPGPVTTFTLVSKHVLFILENWN